MNIAIFGASGATGTLLTQRCLASGYNVTFIHPKGDEKTPLGGEGVLIELVQAPEDVIKALS